MNLHNQIKTEITRRGLRYQNITNIKLIPDDLIFFQADNIQFSARLTQKTGKLKRNSIRIET